MMDKLEIARALIDDAIEEKRRLEKVEADLEALREKKEQGKVSGDYWTQRWRIESQFGAVPKKAHINDNIKVARRLLMEGRV